MMNAKEFVEKYLQKRQCYDELTLESKKVAEDNGLIVVFGMSDDTCILRGAINNETYCYGNDNEIYDIYVNADSGISETDENNKFFHILAKWCCDGYSWVYETDIPHETFEVYEDGEKYCRGIVFFIEDIRPKLTNYDRIKEMSLEEMTKFLRDLSYSYSVGHCDECPLWGECSDATLIKSWLESTD